MQVPDESVAQQAHCLYNTGRPIRKGTAPLVDNTDEVKSGGKRSIG